MPATFDRWKRYDHRRIWRSIADDETIEDFRNQHSKDLDRLCQVIAIAEKKLYDKRAFTLAEAHPLGVQVHLETGVANGVLVVRTIDDCAKLLRRVLTNTLEFDVEVNDKDQMWYLKERISGCVYRVVSSDRKLTNCFWNFYRREEHI